MINIKYRIHLCRRTIHIIPVLTLEIQWDIIGYTLIEVMVHPDILPKIPISHEAEPNVIYGDTDVRGWRAGHATLQGVTNLSPALPW